MKKKIIINNIEKIIIVDPGISLSNVLREHLLLTGTKIGCGSGECGACSVIMNGKVIRSCITPMENVPDKAVITTIEGVGTPTNLHVLQLAWIVHNGAQCGFCSPGFIVSGKALLDENQKPTREEVRDWFQKHHNACRCTGYKPCVDAVMDAARVIRGEIKIDDMTFHVPSDGKIWGTGFPRPTAAARVTGTLDYGADMALKLPEKPLYLALTQARVSHARIISIDTSEALKMPGVSRILTHKDLNGGNRIFNLMNMPTSKSDGRDRPILCDEKIFQYGDAIAIVCAESEREARLAAAKVNVEFEVLPAYMNAQDAMAPDAKEIHPGTPNVYFTVKNIKGDNTGPVMERASFVVEDEFQTQGQPHMPIEPDVGFAYTDPEGVLVIYSKSQALHLHHAVISDSIGIAPEKLVLVNPPGVGATFGYKVSLTSEAFLGVAAMATGRPVVMKYDWHQQQTYTGKRSPWFIKLKLAADAEGKLLAMEGDWTVDHGAYAELGDAVTVRGAQFIGAGYHIPNIRGQGRVVYTNNCWGTAFRGFGSTQSEFASEVLMDELAEKVGIDPLELRYRNVYCQGNTTPTGCAPDVIALPGLMDMLRPLYKVACKHAVANSTDRKKRGVGISVGTYKCGMDGPDTSEAWVELTPQGVTIYVCWEDSGAGGDGGSVITAHEALRPLSIAPEDIRLVANDMRSVPNSGPSTASRQQVVTGQAIKAACESLVKAMKKNNDGYRTYNEMIQEGLPIKHIGTYTVPFARADFATSQGDPFSVYQYAVFMAQVEVDMTTGKTSVLKMTTCADVGVIGSKLAVDGQLYGGLAQGIGFALSEDFKDFERHSTMTGAGFPFIKDIPDDLELHFQQTPRPHGPFGAGGSGELPHTSPHAAIINAIYNACGVRITSLPALPEKVLAGFKSFSD